MVKGLYFSEEIKNWVKLGYKVRVTEGMVFERINNLFNEYINKFYYMKSHYNNPLACNSIYENSEYFI